MGGGMWGGVEGMGDSFRYPPESSGLAMYLPEKSTTSTSLPHNAGDICEQFYTQSAIFLKCFKLIHLP